LHTASVCLSGKSGDRSENNLPSKNEKRYLQFLLESLKDKQHTLQEVTSLAEEINIFRKELSAKEMKPSANRR
jgi:hypothetical protein